MSVSLEQIEKLRERASLTYKEAKEILEQYNGDVLEALINLEGQAKLIPPKAEASESECWGTSKKLMKTVKRLFKKGNETKFVIRKSENKVIDLPVNVLLLFGILALPLTAAGILVALVTHHKLSFVRQNGEDMKINKTLDKISSCVTSVSNQVAEAVQAD